jgi:hypothetical protein
MPMRNLTQVQIAQFLEKEKTNLCAWAKACGYKYVTVFNTVNRWEGKDAPAEDALARGGLARAIMKDLRDGYVRHFGEPIQAGDDNVSVD